MMVPFPEFSLGGHLSLRSMPRCLAQFSYRWLAYEVIRSFDENNICGSTFISFELTRWLDSITWIPGERMGLNVARRLRTGCGCVGHRV